jgi:hypothetical protein
MKNAPRVVVGRQTNRDGGNGLSGPLVERPHFNRHRLRRGEPSAAGIFFLLSKQVGPASGLRDCFAFAAGHFYNHRALSDGASFGVRRFNAAFFRPPEKSVLECGVSTPLSFAPEKSVLECGVSTPLSFAPSKESGVETPHSKRGRQIRCPSLEPGGSF